MSDPSLPATPEAAVAQPRGDLLIICRACRYEFRLAPQFIGKRIPCPHCEIGLDISGDAARVDDPLVGQRIGRCRLTYRLGCGGIGVVYAADQLSVNRQVAVKLLGAKAGANPTVVSRFQRESTLSAQVNHPNVVQVYDCGFEKGVHFQMMELVNGGTLSALIEERGRLPWREAAALMREVADALAHIHALSIIHRDLKPANVLMARDRDGHFSAKLADLGLAKQIDAEVGDTNGLTMEGKPLGSPAYMPPEQVRNAKDADSRSDLYGLGATFYAAITGQRPFDGRTSYEVMAGVLTKDPVAPSLIATDLPPALEALILRLLAKDPTQRGGDAASIVVELDRIIATAAPSAAAPDAPPAPRQRQPGRIDSSTPATQQPMGAARRRSGIAAARAVEHAAAMPTPSPEPAPGPGPAPSTPTQSQMSAMAAAADPGHSYRLGLATGLIIGLIIGAAAVIATVWLRGG